MNVVDDNDTKECLRFRSSEESACHPAGVDEVQYRLSSMRSNVQTKRARRTTEGKLDVVDA